MLSAQARLDSSTNGHSLSQSSDEGSPGDRDPDIETEALGVDGFLYTPLSQKETAGRLIQVLPALHDNKLQLSLWNAEDLSDTKYTALSYMWGPGTDDKDILLNGKSFTTRRNLWDFLCIVRLQYPESPFWIDALCINQQDTCERNHQVQKMGDIYLTATSTIIWLNNCTPNSLGSKSSNDPPSDSLLRDFDASFAEYMKSEEDIRSSKSKRDTQSLKILQRYRKVGPLLAVLEHIFQHPYWNRLWVVQENALSGDRLVILPNLSMSFRSLRLATSWVQNSLWGPLPIHSRVMRRVGVFHRAMECARHQHFLNQGLPSPISSLGTCFGWSVQVSNLLSNWVVPFSSSHIEADRIFARFYYSMARKVIELGDWSLDYLGPRELQRLFTFADCHDRRDKIYGLQALIESNSRINVDYAEDVYGLFFRAYRCQLGGERPWMSIKILLGALDLNPLDLIFGDTEQRSVIIPAVVRAHSSNSSHQVQRRKVSDDQLVFDSAEFSLSGTCPRCQGRIHIYTPHDQPRDFTYFIVQCHRYRHNFQDVSEHFVFCEAARSPFLEIAATAPTPASADDLSLSKWTACHKYFTLDELRWLLQLQDDYHFELDRRVPEAIDHGDGIHWTDSDSFMRSPLDPSGPHKSMMTRFVETMLQRPETIAPENRFYTQEMLDAVRVEDAAKPNFTKALEAHGIHLGVPKKPFYRRT